MRRSEVAPFIRRAARALRRPPREVLTILHVTALIVAVEMLIRSIALSRLSAMLSVRIDLQPATAVGEVLPLARLPLSAQRQLRCTGKVADAWPFSKGPCLRRALVGGHLVRRLGPAVRIGLAGGSDTLLAHAWLEIDGRPLEDVTGFTPFETMPSTATR